MHELPEGWVWKKLGEVCEIKNGKNQSNVVDPNGKYPIYGSAGIMGYATEYLCNEGCTIVGRKGNINSPIYVRTKFWNVDTAFGLSPLKIIDNRLLYFFCLGFNFKKLDKSTTIPSLAKNNLLQIDIPLPPLPVQQAIVTKIEEIFSELDHGVEQLKTARAQLKVYRQAVLKWAFEGRLTNEGVKDGELVEGWKWVRISELCNVVRGGSPRPAGDPRYYDGDIPFLKVGDLTNDSNIYLYNFKHTIKQAGLHKTRKIQPNTLLLSNSGATLGVPKICMIHATMNDGIAAFLELNEKMNLFLYYFWLSKTEELRNINMGAAQPNLNTDIIKNYEIPLPPLSEQHQIVSEIERRLSVCDKLEETIEAGLKQAEVLRAGVLKMAFEGKLV